MSGIKHFYFNGEILTEDKIKISPFDRGFLFADGVYETIRRDYGKTFKLLPHIERLKRSLNEISINITEIPDIERITEELIRRNNFSDSHVLIYLQITRGVQYPRQHYFPGPDVKPTIFISANPFKRNVSAFSNGIKVILEEDTRWMRCDIKSVSLLPNILARQKAVMSNAEEAILVRDGLIMEGSHTTFCGVKAGKFYTAPLSRLILPGITREIIINLCKEHSIPVIEEHIEISDLDNYDEFMVLGTISEVTPVVRVDDNNIRDGKPGPITMKFQGLLTGMMLQEQN
jgi:D-alanine transaminase